MLLLEVILIKLNAKNLGRNVRNWKMKNKWGKKELFFYYYQRADSPRRSIASQGITNIFSVIIISQRLITRRSKELQVIITNPLSHLTSFT